MVDPPTLVYCFQIRSAFGAVGRMARRLCDFEGLVAFLGAFATGKHCSQFCSDAVGKATSCTGERL